MVGVVGESGAPVVGRDEFVPQLPPTQHRTIVVVDVAGFTDPSRTVTHLLAVQEGLYDVLGTAFSEAGIDLGECDVEDRGDGALILLPPTISKSRVADELPARLVAGLHRYNVVHADEAKVKLRVGMHFGEIRRNDHGFVGHAVNHAFRILDAAEAKSALATSRGVLALIASRYFYEEVISQDAGAVPGAYRQIPVEVKKTSTAAWLRLPDDWASPVPQPSGEAEMHEDDRPWEVVSEPDLNRLRDLLADLSVPHLPTLVRRAAGPTVPIPPAGTAWEVFAYLSDFNAGPDGLPPNLAFVDLLAMEVDDQVGERLAEWANHQAVRLRRGDAVRLRREGWTEIPAEPRLYLVFAVEPDAIDERICRLSYWRQDDPLDWPPQLGGSFDVMVDDLEFRTDDLIKETELVWAGESVSAALEFVLPRSLFHLPVHLWQKEHDSGDPRPLCLDYEIAIRSLERMRAAHWHRMWRVRWSSMLRDPSSSRVFLPLASAAKYHRMDAVLSDLEWVGLVMTEAPAPHPKPGAGPDELTAALRSGIPVLCWHPTASRQELQEMVNRLLDNGGLKSLPSRTQSSRKSMYSVAESTQSNLIGGFILLWDDPDRLLSLGQPTVTSPS
ncbi:hypothetical protein [Actinophytocola oryzae]|uniref:Guanylate cyclase domain-containing protein n=1 Tax=Actinophytocola oryzae TaxID=502181 RepID=A0A4R7VSK7_9PSEU|nr:hypothetical protein [Actinophytocola oryzae]TDV52207.1 hypothetical protein CLV71_105338 [Actinophytocola oryzae]